ncbi:MAG TPA: ABC transporter permease [Gammaproteobacteria bacterium]|jgi:putative ABC transport system permease protein
MFLYNLRLALLSLKRDPILTALMIGAVAVGIGVSTTTLAVYHAMSANPIPDKSSQLYAVQLDNWSAEAAYKDPDEPPTQVTFRDGQALMKAAKAKDQNLSFTSAFTVQTDKPDMKPDLVQGRATYRDFFSMFEAPFEFGDPWSKEADDSAQQVVVLSHEENEKLFGDVNSVGKEIVLNNRRFQIVGVLKHWAPSPKFYDLNNGSFDDPEDVFVPLNLVNPMQLHNNGSNSCWDSATRDNSFEGHLNSDCVWLQYWVELPTLADRDAYHDFLDGYVQEQKKMGRFPRPLNNRLNDVMQWLTYNEVVSKDSESLAALSFMFLAVCMLNTIGLILAKFLRRSGEIGLRRAVGASRMALFRQYLVETGVIGVSGGLLGIPLAWVLLIGVRHLIDGSDHYTHLDWTMVGVGLLLAIVASMLAGLYPAWRVVRIPPAIYLKVQ